MYTREDEGQKLTLPSGEKTVKYLSCQYDVVKEVGGDLPII